MRLYRMFYRLNTNNNYYDTKNKSLGLEITQYERKTRALLSLDRFTYRLKRTLSFINILIFYKRIFRFRKMSS